MSSKTTQDPTYNVGALPPYKVSHIRAEVCATSHDQWFVMGTVDGNPRNGQGPVAICEYEPSAHAIAALLNATVKPGAYTVRPPKPSLIARLIHHLAAGLGTRAVGS